MDSNENSAQEIQRFLKISAFAFQISHAATVPDGLDFLRNHPADLVLLDTNITNSEDFADFKQTVAELKTPVILLSDNISSAELKNKAQHIGAVDYLTKNKVNLFSLQKIINHTLKLNETESRFDHAIEEYTSRQEAYALVLNRISEGVMIVNRDNLIRFVNEQAYKILADAEVRSKVSNLIAWQEIEGGEEFEIRSPKRQVLLKLSTISWMGEQANLIIFKESVREGSDRQQIILEVLSSLLDNIQSGMILLQNDRIVYANRFAAEKLLIKQSALISQKIQSLFRSENPLWNSSTLKDFMNDHSSTAMVQLGDGSERKVVQVIRYLNFEGTLYQLLSFEILALNPEVDAPKSSREKDRFSTDDVLHLASHDLREPVRTILNYVQLISGNLSQGKYDEANEYAAFAQQAASRMDTLLSDLKVLVALNDYAFTISKVSMKTVVENVLKSLKQKIESTEAHIQVAKLPDISADRELVEKLVFHLVDNALKFHQKNKPLVDIGFDKYEGNIIFCVRDHGIGISKKFHSKIFESFERLNRVDEFSGNGLGLAICKKIVEMHGGKIWVESMPGAGSSFYFSLRSR